MFIPRIKDRDYYAPIKNESGAIVRHACTRCDQILPIKAKGVWFERADVPGRWVWVCETCCAVRGIYVG